MQIRGSRGMKFRRDIRPAERHTQTNVNSNIGEPAMKVFTTGQVAKICKVAPRTVSKWFDSGRLTGISHPRIARPTHSAGILDQVPQGTWNALGRPGR